LAVGGLALAGYVWWFLFAKDPQIDKEIQAAAGPLTAVLENKYGFDDFNQRYLAGGSRSLGAFFWNQGDRTVIDGIAVNGSAKSVGWLAGQVRHLQTGYLYHYAIAMIVGLVGLLAIYVAI
jgi:NADH-quinone oxidoreductase subunit L